jgi:hypothetical protein
LIIAFLAGLLIYFFTRQKKQKRKMSGNQKADEISAGPIATEIPVQQLRLFPHVYTLDKAKEYLESGYTKAFYKETETVILSVLKEWYAIEVEAGLEKMEKQLTGKYLPADTVKSAMLILDECQMALYSPFLMEDKMRSDYEKARQVLDILQSPQT